MIISRGTPHDQVMQFAERVREGAASRPIEIGDQNVPVTVSIGLASYEPLAEPDLTMMELLVRADAALYRSKCDGRNRVSGWTASPMGPGARRTLVEGDTLRIQHPNIRRG